MGVGDVGGGGKVGGVLRAVEHGEGAGASCNKPASTQLPPAHTQGVSRRSSVQAHTALSAGTLKRAWLSLERALCRTQLTGAARRAPLSSPLSYLRLHTTLGDINVELHCDVCPRTCENFLALAESGARAAATARQRGWR